MADDNWQLRSTFERVNPAIYGQLRSDPARFDALQQIEKDYKEQREAFEKRIKEQWSERVAARLLIALSHRLQVKNNLQLLIPNNNVTIRS